MERKVNERICRCNCRRVVATSAGDKCELARTISRLTKSSKVNPTRLLLLLSGNMLISLIILIHCTQTIRTAGLEAQSSGSDVVVAVDHEQVAPLEVVDRTNLGKFRLLWKS